MIAAGLPFVAMTPTPDLFYQAAQYHRALPERIRAYLNGRGIPDRVIDHRLLGWNGSRITIPIFNQKGVCAFFRLAKGPDETSDAPKMISSRGSSVELYGWETLRLRPKRLIICEGEFDRLVLEANGFVAVTSTGGAGTFKREWATATENAPEIYVCFDRDEAGRKGAKRVSNLIPRARFIELPEEVGEGGDVTDFFVRLGKTPEEFEKLMINAIWSPQAGPALTPKTRSSDGEFRRHIDELKGQVPIERVVGCYVELRPSGKTLVGLCPLHEDHRPSFTVYPGQGIFHCYGCGEHGDALNFLQLVEHLSFRQARVILEKLIPHDGEQAG